MASDATLDNMDKLHAKLAQSRLKIDDIDQIIQIRRMSVIKHEPRLYERWFRFMNRTASQKGLLSWISDTKDEIEDLNYDILSVEEEAFDAEEASEAFQILRNKHEKLIARVKTIEETHILAAAFCNDMVIKQEIKFLLHKIQMEYQARLYCEDARQIDARNQIKYSKMTEDVKTHEERAEGHTEKDVTGTKNDQEVKTEATDEQHEDAIEAIKADAERAVTRDKQSEGIVKNEKDAIEADETKNDIEDNFGRFELGEDILKTGNQNKEEAIKAEETEDEFENTFSEFKFNADYIIKNVVETFVTAKDREKNNKNSKMFVMKKKMNWRKRRKKMKGVKRKRWNEPEDEKPEQTDDDIEATDDVTKETSAYGVQKENNYACNECETKTWVNPGPQGTRSSLFSKGTMPCSHCDKRFANTRELATHIEIIHERRYPLSRHMKSHSEERPHKCSVCEKLFKTLAKLQDHVNTHTSKGPHKCKYCEARFTTMSKLKKHMRCHSGEKPHQCECDICHAEFTRSNNLKEHKTIHTGDGSVYQCKLCHTTCNRKADLRLHVQKLHTSKKPMQCEMCGKRLPDRNALKVHEKKHTRERCSKCDSCPYRSISQRHLKTHMLIHKNQKPFQCDGCDQSFRQRQLLKRHQSLYHKPALGRNSSLDDNGKVQGGGIQQLSC